MPIQFNFGTHGSARHAEERLREHFRIADKFIFEQALAIGPDSVKRFLKGSLSKKEIVKFVEEEQFKLKGKLDAFLEGKSPFPSEEIQTPYKRRAFELLREENQLRKQEGRKPVQHFLEEIDYRSVGAFLEERQAREKVVNALRKGDCEEFLKYTFEHAQKNLNIDIEREQRIAKLARSLEERKHEHIGVEIGALHFPMHEEMKSAGANMLSPRVYSNTSHPFLDAIRAKKATKMLAGTTFIASAILGNEPEGEEKSNNVIATASMFNEDDVKALVGSTKGIQTEVKIAEKLREKALELLEQKKF